MTRWLVIHSIRGASGLVRRPRVLVDGAPSDPGQVREALEAAGYAVMLSDGGVPWGNHILVQEGRWQGVDVDQVPDQLPGGLSGRVDWSELATPVERRLTLRLGASLHHRVTMAAEAAGVSLQSWSVRALEAALTGAAAPPPALRPQPRRRLRRRPLSRRLPR